MASYIGLPRKEPDPVDFGGGDDPDYARRVARIEQHSADPSVAQSAVDTALHAARATQPRYSGAGNGGVYDDMASLVPPMQTGGDVAQRSPIVAQHLTQATGPMGTINQIGEPVDTTSQAQRPMATQADLDAFNRESIPAAPPPGQYDPNRPEEAGAEAQRQGLGLQERAAVDSNAADAREADAAGKLIEERNAQLQKDREQAAKEQAGWDQRRKEIEADVKQKTDDWANYKIDRGRRWRNASTGQKLSAMIGVAMSALGDALQYKSGPNGALQSIYKIIDDDVADQVDEREQLGKVASRARSSLDDYRTAYGDWQQAKAAKMAEEYKRTADEIERLSMATRSDKAKANALAMVGDLRTRAGALEQGIAASAFKREFDLAKFQEDKRAARVAEGQRQQGLNMQRDQFNEEMKFKRDQLAAQQKLATDEYLAKATAEQAKELKQTGIKDPTTNQYIMSDGQPVTGRDVGEATKIQAAVAGTQTLLSGIDRIKAKIANTPGFQTLNPDQKQAAIGSELDALVLAIKDTYGTGALDAGSVSFTRDYTGGDPTKLDSKGLFSALGFGDSKAEVSTAKLDVVAKAAETRSLNMMGNPKGWKFARDEKVQETPANKAAQDVYRESSLGKATTEGAVEAAGAGAETKVPATVDAKGGLLPQLVDVPVPTGAVATGDKRIFGALGAAKDWIAEKRQRNAEESTDNSQKYIGFRKDREPALDTLVAGSKSADPSVREQSQQRIVDMVADQKTTGMSDAAMSLVRAKRDEIPDLYQKALKALPEDKRNLVIALDSASPVSLYETSGIPINKLPTQPVQSGPVASPSHIYSGRNQ